MCRSHAVHGVHGVHPPSQLHPHCHNSMQMACESAEREKRDGEEREEGQLTPSLHHTSSRHTPPLIFPPFLPSPSSSLSLHPPPIHTLSSPLTWLTTTSTSLLLSLTHPNPHPKHVPVHKETQQQQQQPHHSRSSPPAAHVLLHLHATHAHTSSKWYMCE